MRIDCAHPVSAPEIFDYWAGELESRDEDRIEAHVFTCASCAAALAEGEALASGIRQVVRSGTFQSLISDAVLNRLARDGARVRTFSVSPGHVVPCAVWDEDELVVTRLLGDFSGVDAVSVVTTLATGEELSRSDGVAIQPGQRELITAISAEWLRALPAITVQMRVTAVRDGQDQLVGEYTLEHAGALGHG
jgi:hypothetical protein